MTVGSGPYGITVNPNSNLVYTANNYSNTVSVINGTTDSLFKGDIHVGRNPFYLAINPNTDMNLCD